MRLTKEVVICFQISIFELQKTADYAQKSIRLYIIKVFRNKKEVFKNKKSHQIVGFFVFRKVPIVDQESSALKAFFRKTTQFD